jgi:CRISPR system Cascade subunit CasC
VRDTPRFVNFHILHPIPFSNPNRDDTGAPKTTVYGGTVRGRLSSQADKRASRIGFEGGSDADRTARTKFAARHLADKVEALLAANGTTLDADQATKLQADIKKELGKLTGASDEAKDTLVWLAEAEVNRLATKVAAKHADSGLALDAADIAEVLSTFTESLTIAAFGRMFANRADLQIEAAVQVAHAFTTHTQQIDLDYFTAVDDLQASYDTPDADGKVKGAGAGHLDVNEYHSGVFYRYFNVNRDDLNSNWGPLARGDDGDDVVGRLGAFLTEMIRELPRGRDATAAHQTAPAHVMVTFSRRGTSYAPAFEAPVEADGGYVAPSVERLAAYADRIVRVDGEDRRLVFDLNDETSVPLPEIIDAAARWLAGGDDATEPRG